MGQAGLVEVLVELLLRGLVPVAEEPGADEQHVVRLDGHALLLGGGHQVGVVEGLALVQVGLAAVPGHVDEHPAADDALLRDRLHGGLRQPADGGLGVVAVPDPAVVPDVPERVVLRRALQEDLGDVVGVVQPAREVRGVAAARRPARLVEDVLPLDALAPGEHRVALGMAHRDLQREHLAGADVPHAAQHLRRIEVVQAAQLVFGTPLAPVRRGVLAEHVAHGR